MTVIMGINLSDRVCLVADSRVSEKDESTGVFKPKHDNMMKIEPLRDTRGAMVASAGNAALARRVLKALNSEYKGKTIVDIRNGIEGTLRRIGEEYGAIDRFAHANFLIAGVDENTYKVIDKERFNVIATGEYMQSNSNASVGWHFVDALQSTAEDGDELVLPLANTMLFSVSLDMAAGVDIKDSQWGDALVLGPSETTLEDVGDDEIAKLEFDNASEGDLQARAERDGMLSVAFASTMTRKYDWLTVGGAYVPIQVLHTGHVVTLPRKFMSYDPVTGDVEEVSAHYMENGKFYRMDENGAKHRLYLVSELSGTKSKKKHGQGGELQV